MVLWLQGGESKFSIYVHSRPGFLFNKVTTRSDFFLNRQVNDSIQVAFLVLNTWVVDFAMLMCVCEAWYVWIGLLLILYNVNVHVFVVFEWGVWVDGAFIVSSCVLYQVDWGEATMIEAERILLKHALEDPLNQRFAFVSDRWRLAWWFFLLVPCSVYRSWWCSLSNNISVTWFLFSCIPLYSFKYIYDYVMSTRTSFVDRWVDQLKYAVL